MRKELNVHPNSKDIKTPGKINSQNKKDKVETLVD